MATLQSGKCFTVPTFFGMCCRSDDRKGMYIYKWHEVDQTKHEIFCVHIVCNEIQVKVNLEILLLFYLRFPYCPNFFLIWGCKFLHLIQVCGPSSLLEMRPKTTVSSANFDNRCGAVRGTRSHVCRESRAGDSGHNSVGLLRSGWWSWGELADFHHWGLPVRKSWIQSQSEEFSLRSVSLEASLMGDYGVESWAIVNEKQPCKVPIAAVNVCEGGMEYVRDGIISRSIGTIGKLKGVQSNRDGGANVALNKSLKHLHDYWCQVKSSHLYLYSAFNNTNCDKATAQYQNGKIVSIM